MVLSREVPSTKGVTGNPFDPIYQEKKRLRGMGFLNSVLCLQCLAFFRLDSRAVALCFSPLRGTVSCPSGCQVMKLFLQLWRVGKLEGNPNFPQNKSLASPTEETAGTACKLGFTVDEGSPSRN